jgi:hypothetical protein
VAAPESAQPLGRLRKFDPEDYGPAPSLSAPTAPAGPAAFNSPFGLPSAGPGDPAGPGGPGGPVGAPGAGGSGGGFGSASAAAAAAARIPRFSGGAPDSGGGTGGFNAFGNSGTSGGGGGASGPAGLPVRQPGGRGPQQSGGQGGGSVLGGAAEDGDTDFGAARIPSFGSDGGAASSGPLPVLGAGSGAGNGNGSDGSQVTVPPIGNPAQDQRLPIFDSLESDWFRRSGKSLSPDAAPEAAQAWSSPADEGWRAARVAAAPETGETTTAGLPKRVPRANLVPGSVGGGEDSEVAPPARSADTIRSRMASFQRGVREARAAAPQIEEP